jgi:hypothetical protein
MNELNGKIGNDRKNLGDGFVIGHNADPGKPAHA